MNSVSGKKIGKEALLPFFLKVEALRKKNPGKILFFRVGDFYECFAGDAVLVARELEIVLTSKKCTASDLTIDRCHLAGFPVYSIDRHRVALTTAGHSIHLTD